MQKEITLKQYNKLMSRIIDDKLEVHEKLIKLLEEASKYVIKEPKQTGKVKSRKVQDKRLDKPRTVKEDSSIHKTKIKLRCCYD